MSSPSQQFGNFPGEHSLSPQSFLELFRVVIPQNIPAVSYEVLEAATAHSSIVL
jgi:hypothetical protein